jgi:hypothetical protein
VQCGDCDDGIAVGAFSGRYQALVIDSSSMATSLTATPRKPSARSLGFGDYSIERGDCWNSNAQKALGGLAVAPGDILPAHGSLRSPFAIAVLAP